MFGIVVVELVTFVALARLHFSWTLKVISYHGLFRTRVRRRNGLLVCIAAGPEGNHYGRRRCHDKRGCGAPAKHGAPALSLAYDEEC